MLTFIQFRKLYGTGDAFVDSEKYTEYIAEQTREREVKREEDVDETE